MNFVRSSQPLPLLLLAQVLVELQSGAFQSTKNETDFQTWGNLSACIDNCVSSWILIHFGYQLGVDDILVGETPSASCFELDRTAKVHIGSNSQISRAEDNDLIIGATFLTTESLWLSYGLQNERSTVDQSPKKCQKIGQVRAVVAILAYADP